MRPIVLAGAVALAGGVAGAVLFASCSSPDPVELLDTLRPGGRLNPGRSSLDRVRRPSSVPDHRERVEAVLAELLQLPASSASRGPALVSFFLWRGAEGDLDRAQRAAAAQPQGWARENDLGLVDLARGEAEAALERFQAGLEHTPGQPALLFNRALALEALHLTALAKEAWEEAARVSEPGFREECEAHAARTPPEKGESIEERKRMVQRALVRTNDRADAEALRAEVEALAALNEPMPRIELDHLLALPQGDWPTRNLERDGFLREQEAFPSGRHRLARFVDHPEPLMAVLAAHFLSFERISGGAGQEALPLLDGIEARCRTLGCTTELSNALSDKAAVQANDGDHDGALALVAEALLVVPANNAYRRATLERMRAAFLLRLGRAAEARRSIRHSIEGFWLGGYARDKMMLAALKEAASIAEALGQELVAELYLREALTMDDRLRNSRFWAQRALANLLLEQGRPAECAEIARAALSELGPEPAEAGLRAQAEALLARALVATGRTAEARRSLETQLERTSSTLYRQEPLAAIARVELAEGHAAEAARASDEVIELLRRKWAELADPIDRRANEAGAELALFARVRLAAGDARGALDLLAGTRVADPEAGECRILLAADGAHLLVLSLAGGEVRVDERNTGRVHVARQIRRLGDVRGRGYLERLQAIVGAPWGARRCPDATSRLAIVQSPFTLQAPLARLARHLRPEVAVAIAANASRPWPGPISVREALVVRDPVSSRPALPASVREAAALAARFRTRELAGPEATPSRVLEALPGAGLIHLATHGESGPALGAGSFLVLSGGKLRSRDVLRARLRDPLVVLSACETLEARITGAEGGTLPLAFLLAGARAVVASGQLVEDALAGAYAEAFYRTLASGEPVWRAHEAALQELRRLRGPDAAEVFTLVF